MSPARVPATPARPPTRGSCWLEPGRRGAGAPAVFRIACRRSPDFGKFMVCPSAADVPFDPDTGRPEAYASAELALCRLLQIEGGRP